MTKKTPKPTAQHMQKLADLMDTRPEGVTTRQVQNTLSVSPAMAKAALVEIGAVEQDGKWMFAEVEKSALGIHPDLIRPSLAGHKCFAERAGVILGESASIEPEPLKKLTQAVFDGLPSEYRWAAVDADSTACAFRHETFADDSRKIHAYVDDGNSNTFDGKKTIRIGIGYDATDWKNSRIEREPVCTTCKTETDIAPLSLTGECQGCYEDAVDKAWWDTQGGMFKPVEPEPATKSDFAIALEAERQRVLEAVKIGGTVERLAERTGLHVDDVQMHLDALIVDGAVYQKPIIVGVSYGVMG